MISGKRVKHNKCSAPRHAQVSMCNEQQRLGPRPTFLSRKAEGNWLWPQGCWVLWVLPYLWLEGLAPSLGWRRDGEGKPPLTSSLCLALWKTYLASRRKQEQRVGALLCPRDLAGEGRNGTDGSRLFPCPGERESSHWPQVNPLVQGRQALDRENAPCSPSA